MNDLKSVVTLKNVSLEYASSKSFSIKKLFLSKHEREAQLKKQRIHLEHLLLITYHSLLMKVI
ncbi:hypothetical protein [Photobacterium damselae]|uniref:hypothetical protein n=1 Tax=Photobacterium damselae TaxID=38293 RepID=UPI001F30F0C9|nr:hypothetical protein [Photobacterium damselae]UKA02522.1 hypothetical protein IHC89_04155 [Photobacterium damselae subsp. damselae]